MLKVENPKLEAEDEKRNSNLNSSIIVKGA